MPNRRFISLFCAIACTAAFPAAAAATVSHESSGGIVRVTEPPLHDTNICGLPGTFRMTTMFEWHATETSAGYHFELTEISRWTVTLDDPALGVWQGRGTETDVFNAAPGDLVTFHVVFNGSEGPVRIHEHVTVLVVADGTPRVDIDQVTTDFGACPA